jgi:phosphatidylinositol-3-phosphatase
VNGAAENAAPMADFFNTAALAAAPGIVISTPGNGATITGAVHLLASASENQTISQTQVWDNGNKLGVFGPQIDAIFTLAPGKHTTTVLDLDSSYHILRYLPVTYTVQPLVDGVQVISPSPNQVISGTTVHVVAEASESEPISQMQVWDSGRKLGWYAGSSVNQYYALDPGWHQVTVEDLDEHYQIIHYSTVTYDVQ